MIIDSAVFGETVGAFALLAEDGGSTPAAWGATIALLITTITGSVVTIINAVRGKRVREDVREIRKEINGKDDHE